MLSRIIALKAVKVVYPFPVPILGVLTFFSTELEKENMLECHHVIEEAMSKSATILFFNLPDDDYSSCTNEKLSSL